MSLRKRGAGPAPGAPSGGPLRLLLAAVCAAALALGLGAAEARADQAGERFALSVSGEENPYCGSTPLRPVVTEGGDQVFCVELGVDNQTGVGTVADLVGSETRYSYNGDGSGAPTSRHTWTQDAVTEAALIYQWSVQRYNWDWAQGAEAYKMQWGYFQRMLWMYCNSGFSLDNMGNMARWPEAVSAAEVACYVRANKAAYVGRGLLYAPEGGRQASVRLWTEPSTGSASLRKSSAKPALTENNPNYSLAGAVYGVYSDAGCTTLVAELTTGEDGSTGAAELSPGAYYVKETKASKGYGLCGEVHAVTVEAGREATVTCEEPPVNDPAGVAVYKQDSAGRAVAQGDAGLAGAEFTVRFYAVDPESVNSAADLAVLTPRRTWVVRTAWDAERGAYVACLGDAWRVSGDEWYEVDEQGYAHLPIGAATVEETRAPEGYRKAAGACVVRVMADGTVNYAKGDWSQLLGQQADGGAVDDDVAVSGSVLGSKVDSERDESVPQGDATLKGAEVTLTNRSAAAVVVGGETVEPGADYSRPAVTDESGNWSFEGLPYGTYEVRETKPSAGYRLNASWRAGFEVREDGEEIDLTGQALAEDVQRGSVSGVKVDSARDESVAQGDATLKGAEITLTNRSAAAVVVGGERVEPGADYSRPAVTDEEGNWSFEGLPYGTYEVRETKPSKGYRLNASWFYSFEVREDGEAVTDGRKARLAQDVARGGVGAVKVDAQRDEAVAEGAATLAGAELQIKNVSDGSVFVDGVEYRPGDVIDPEKSLSAKLVTDGEGLASTSPDALPYGTYELTEAKASKGYLLNESWKAVLEVREDGQIYWADGHGENGHLEEQVVRGDFNFDKIEAFSQSEMAGIPFLVTSRATGESHVVVTDGNGQVDTASSFTRHSESTNASDAALNADKTAVADESKLVTDGSAGVWFHGYADHEVAVDDSLGALPYDVYDVAELAVKANAGHNLVSFTVTVARDGVNVDKGTKEDSEVNIGTRLTYGGEKEAPMGESVTLTDEVDFENVKRGAHAMTAVIHAVDAEGNDLGEVARVTKEFTNKVTTGSVNVDIDLDTTKLGGRRLVCFEYLDLKEDGTCAAKHEDLSDEDQTVRVPNPEISTKASGDVGPEALADGSAELTDTVAYTGLTPGKRYVLVATLHVRGSDGSDAGALTDASGSDVEARVAFTPKSADGEAEVKVNIDASALAGKTVVFFESLTRDEAVVASHADISDEGQSVSFPKLATHASERDSGEQVAEAKASVTITDEVSYSNLQAGREYKVSGTLHVKADDGSDAGVLTDAGGNPVTAEKTFTPEKAAGTVNLEFTLDASALAGKTVVAFEDLSRDGVAVGTHADITDEGQSVRFPKVATTLTDAEGKHETQLSGPKATVELTDAVAYENLEPGRAYKVSGTLHKRAADGSDAGAVEGASAAAEFTPESESGTVEVKFTLDASKVGEGEAVVAFEELALAGDGDITVARHADISDEGQTVNVVDIKTSLAGDASGTHEEQASERTCVRDTVSYTGLTPNKTYKVAGTLHVKGSGGSDAGVLTDADGNPVRAEAEFTPAESAGEVELEFTFDGSALAGKSVVAFETLSRDGADIAVHADITDEGQTVGIVSIGTEATDKADGDHEVEAAKGVSVEDAVSYKGLTPGREYKVSGTLHVKAADGSDAGALKDADGNPVRAEASFTPEKADGEASVEFAFDASALGGKTVVAFEELSRDGATVATHADISDEGQSVSVRQPDAPSSPDMPKTGVGPLPLFLVCAGAAAAALAGGKLARDRLRARRDAGK